MKTCPLLWGVSLLLSVGTMGTPITDSISSTVKADQMETAHVHRHEPEENSGPTHKPAEVTSTPPVSVVSTEVITDTQGQLLQTHTTPESKATASDPPAPSGSRTTTVPSTEGQTHLQTPTTSTAGAPPETASITLPTTAGTTSTTAGTTSPTSASSSQGSSTTGTTTFELFSTVPPDSSPEVPSLIHKPSSPAVPQTSSVKVNTATGSPPMLDHTSSFAESRTEMLTATASETPPPPPQKPIPVTTSSMSTVTFPDTTKLRSPAESSQTNAYISTTTVSNHSGGILIPVSPRKLPVPTSKSVSTVTKMSQSPPTANAQSCSVRRVVKQCLVVVAALAALATIFMVSTIVLCTKLSMRKYRVKRPQQDTEMMCISALLPERNHNYRRQRSPVSNGVLVIPSGADSDDDGGDNLTLSSFLPENDRLV